MDIERRFFYTVQLFILFGVVILLVAASYSNPNIFPPLWPIFCSLVFCAFTLVSFLNLNKAERKSSIIEVGDIVEVINTHSQDFTSIKIGDRYVVKSVHNDFVVVDLPVNRRGNSGDENLSFANIILFRKG